MKKLLLLVMVAIIASVTFVFADEDNDEDVKEMIEEKCSLCHTPDYAFNNSNTEQGWRDTVTRMVEENGAELTDEEFDKIVKYLAEHRGK